MSSILSSQAVVLATAMAAVSGTVILVAALRHHKTPRPCLSSASDGAKSKKKKKKSVHFAEDVVEPSGDGVEFRKRHRKQVYSAQAQQPSSSSYLNSNCSDFDDDDEDAAEPAGSKGKITGMPANRVALYNGMIRDRVGHRLGCSY